MSGRSTSCTRATRTPARTLTGTASNRRHPISALSEHNQHHVRELLEYEEDTFPFLLDTYVGNHLLKTVALTDALEADAIDGVIPGVRWDERDARADGTFFSPRHAPEIHPPHDRIQPILQFDETDVWDVVWNYVVPDSGYRGGVPGGRLRPAVGRRST